MILLPEYLQADRARSDERRNPVLAEKRNVVIHHLAGRIGFTGELQRPAAANAALLVRPPDLFARSLENPLHRQQDTGRQQGHTPGEITHAALAGRTVHPLKILVALLIGRIAHRVAGIQTQRIEFDPHRTALFAAAAHQAVVRHRLTQVVIPPVTQEIDRLHVVDPQFALQLTRVDADAAPRAGIGLKTVERSLLLGRMQLVAAQKNQGNFGEDMHITREGQHYEK